MTKVKALFIGLIIGFTTLAIYSYIQIPMSWHEISYVGREIFYTEVDFTQFKKSLLDEDIHVDKLTVVDGTLPIVVDFKIHIEKDIDESLDYPYGKPFSFYKEIEPIRHKDDSYAPWTGAYIGGVVGSVLLTIYFFASGLYAETKEEII